MERRRLGREIAVGWALVWGLMAGAQVAAGLSVDEAATRMEFVGDHFELGLAVRGGAIEKVTIN